MLEDGTYDKDGQKIIYPNGYQVGLWDRPTNAHGQSLEWVIKNMTRTTDTFGAWTDSNGDFYVEPCVWIPDLESALRIAASLNQIAIWDWSTMSEIRVKPKIPWLRNNRPDLI